MDKAKILERLPPTLSEILVTKPFLPDYCIASYVSPALEDEPSYRVLLLEEAWIHLIEVGNPTEGRLSGEFVTRYSVRTDAVKSIETRWETDDTFVDLADALERSSSFKATIRLEQELGSVGERLVLPLNDSDDGNMRAAKEAQAFVQALLSARS